MENFPYNSSYPNSVNSSPRSRDVDLENPSSWDEPLNSTYKVKFMCSYGGRIHLRPHDNQLIYVGGDTKILAVDRNIKYFSFISKLSLLSDSSEVCFKYQLPGEDLDALISVTNDEDLEHLMMEYDRLNRSSAKPARLRLFIFPAADTNPESSSSFGSDDSKGVRQWFVDALNSVQIGKNQDGSPPSEAAEKGAKNSDLLFGSEKGQPQPENSQDSLPVAPTVMVRKAFRAAASEERRVIGESPAPRSEIQRQMHQEYQKMQISGHSEDYYQHSTAAALQQQRAVHMAAPAPPVYLIQTPTGVYQTPAVRPVTGQVGQGYYGVQRMVVPEVYREQPVYNAMVQPASSAIIQPQKVNGAYTADVAGLARPPAVGEGGGYAQVGYDAMGRQVYYTPPGVVVQPPPYQVVPPVAGGVDVRQARGGAMINLPEGR